MNKIENLYDEFFNSKDIQQANVIINEVTGKTKSSIL